MDEQRISLLETDVAVIKSNYVRNDAFAELKVTVESNFAFLNQKIDDNFNFLNQKMDSKFHYLDEKIDRKIHEATVTILKWTFAMQLTFTALILGAVKYF